MEKSKIKMIIYNWIGILLVLQSVISVRQPNVRLLNILPKQHEQQDFDISSDEISLDNFDYVEDMDYDDDAETQTVPISPRRNEDETISNDVTSSTTILPYDIFTCCSKEFGECRRQCENISQQQWDTTHQQLRWELKKYCPSKQTDFWSCMNKTIEAVAHGAFWSGRRCCHLGAAPKCRNACGTSASKSELLNKCRWSDEQDMMTCFERQEAGDNCCSKARTSQCLQACHHIFEPNNIHNQTTKYHQLQQQCDERNNDVLICVQKIMNIETINNVQKYIPCCNYANSDKCRQSCRDALNASDSMDIIIADMENSGCGKPMPHLPLWQCFLTATHKLNVPTISATITSNENIYATIGPKDISQLNEIGYDAAKLHCCEKSSSSQCRRLCTEMYSNNWWEKREKFETVCLQQPDEQELRQCVDEVEHPCELGCDGLSFCTNFNNRPTELFRSCKVTNDAAAREDLKLLQQRGTIQIMNINLQIKNATRCAPAKWKAIVCTLQLKPCTRFGHYNNICRRDCYDLLNECLDWTHQGATLNVDAICARLQPAHADVTSTPCISLTPYLEESDAPKETGGHHALTSPCKGKPCNASEVCIPSRNGSSKAYECISGCAVGDTTNYLVPLGAFVRIPVLETKAAAIAAPTMTTLGTPIAHFKVCSCSMFGRIEHCQLLPSFAYRDCILPSGRSFKHGTSFYLECNLCSCFANEITCTKRQCRLPGYTDVTYTSLPCNCPTHYVPVCGNNGNTYHSACLAKCMGLQDSEFEYGACSSWNACRDAEHACPVGTQCIEKRKICLSQMQRPCQQYQCVNQTFPCASIGQHVCDNKGHTYNSACALLHANAQFNYWGNCQSGCSAKGPVCGINGVTYPNECVAWADFIVVDYRGRCREVGLLTHDMGRRCRTVSCPNPISKYCRNIVPPGACCPICAGGGLRLIYSRKQLDRGMYALRGRQTELLTLKNMLNELDAMIQIAECQLTGMLTMEVGIFVAIVPRVVRPTRIQIEACGREAEKLSTLISSQTHRITTNLVLSSLIVSHMIDANVENSASLQGVSLTIPILLSFFLTFVSKYSI